MAITVEGHDDLTFYAGTDRRLIFTVSGLPDLIGLLAAHWVLVPGYKHENGRHIALNDGTPVLEKTLGGGGVVLLSAADETIAVELAAADTEALDGPYYDEIALKLASADQDVVSFGQLNVLPRTVPQL